MKPVAVVIGCVVTLLAVTDAGALVVPSVAIATDQRPTGLGVRDASIHAIPFAASASLIALASVSEPSGLLALVLVMITLGVGGVMRLAHELRVLIARCGQRRIDLDRVRRWWIDQQRPAR